MLKTVALNENRSRDYDYRYCDGLIKYGEEQQKANLAKLADFLEHFEYDLTRFHMLEFFKGKDLAEICNLMSTDPSKIYDNKCGTAACALGWAPEALGVAPRFGDLLDFSREVLGVGHQGNVDEFDFLFSGDWACIDNTPYGAADRIRMYLERGLPDAFAGDDINWLEIEDAYETGGYDAVYKLDGIYCNIDWDDDGWDDDEY